jgi:hypothetical protein
MCVYFKYKKKLTRPTGHGLTPGSGFHGTPVTEMDLEKDETICRADGARRALMNGTWIDYEYATSQDFIKAYNNGEIEDNDGPVLVHGVRYEKVYDAVMQIAD